jgi:hypothetical protein
LWYNPDRLGGDLTTFATPSVRYLRGVAGGRMAVSGELWAKVGDGMKG